MGGESVALPYTGGGLRCLAPHRTRPTSGGEVESRSVAGWFRLGLICSRPFGRRAQ